MLSPQLEVWDVDMALAILIAITVIAVGMVIQFFSGPFFKEGDVLQNVKSETWEPTFEIEILKVGKEKYLYKSLTGIDKDQVYSMFFTVIEQKYMKVRSGKN